MNFREVFHMDIHLNLFVPFALPNLVRPNLVRPNLVRPLLPLGPLRSLQLLRPLQPLQPPQPLQSLRPLSLNLIVKVKNYWTYLNIKIFSTKEM